MQPYFPSVKNKKKNSLAIVSGYFFETVAFRSKKPKTLLSTEKKTLMLYVKTDEKQQVQIMGLPMRITYNDRDYVYQINNSSSINKTTTELQVVLNGETVDLMKDDRKVWIQKGDNTLDPEFIQALGRSVSLRFRM